MTKEEITKVVYKTADGQIFEKEHMAIKHEKSLLRNIDVRLLVDAVSYYCIAHDCTECKLFSTHRKKCILGNYDVADWIYIE